VLMDQARQSLSDPPSSRAKQDFQTWMAVAQKQYGYHSYFMANTRLCLGVEVLSGKQHAARHGLPGLWSLLDALPRTHWPTMLRGDCGYGNELLLSEAEARGLPCLFKPKNGNGSGRSGIICWPRMTFVRLQRIHWDTLKPSASHIGSASYAISSLPNAVFRLN